MVALKVLIKEVAAEVRDGGEKRENTDVLAKGEVPKAKETTETKDENQDGGGEAFGD
jgi:hypothetical protein